MIGIDMSIGERGEKRKRSARFLCFFFFFPPPPQKAPHLLQKVNVPYTVPTTTYIGKEKKEGKREALWREEKKQEITIYETDLPINMHL